LPDLNFHDLKHTAGTALLDEGINIKTAQSRLGHANPQTTLALYAQATVQADPEASDRLGERFRPRDGSSTSEVPARPEPPLTWDFAGGARWNRTTDLSIISAAL
jgi:hypothetical protein